MCMGNRQASQLISKCAPREIGRTALAPSYHGVWVRGQTFGREMRAKGRTFGREMGHKTSLKIKLKRYKFGLDRLKVCENRLTF